jgi:KDO2-lipid IV(A) lauroyltransferase
VKRHTLQDRVEYALARGLEAGVSVLPSKAAARLGEVVGTIVRSPLGIRRSTVDSNLRRAFPDASPEWIQRVRRESYRHLGREAVEMMRLSHLSREEVIERTDAPRWAEFESARAEGRGVLLVTGHYGNWEVAAAAVAARGVPIEAVVKRQRNRLVDARIEAARKRLGIGTIDMRSAPKRIPRALAQGHAVGIVADQDARGAGVWVPFFGVPASTFRGPALFALKFRAPVYAAIARRLPGGRYSVEGRRIDPVNTGDLEHDVRVLTTAFAAHLEGEIREDPGQYFWFHKRWKTAPPAELPSGVLGTTTTLPDSE